MNKYDTVTDINRLTDLIDDATQRAQRPRLVPREALAQGLQSALGGGGVGCATWATLAYFGIGNGMEAGAFVGVLFFGASLGLRSIADEVVDIHRLNKIKRKAEKINNGLKVACLELDMLSDAKDQLQRDLDTERIIRAQLQERLRNQPASYVKAKPEPEPQEVRDAREIIDRWFGQNVYISRQKAADLGWTQGRHRAAAALLTDAGIVGSSGQQTVFLVRSMDEAQRKLSDHLIRIKAQAEPLDVAEQEAYDR